MKKILGISLVAMMAVTAANAEIASKQYVDNQDTAAIATAGTNAANAIATAIGTLGNIPNTETPYANVKAYVDDKVAGATSGTSSAIEALDATATQTATAENGQLALSVTEENGVITAVSGSIAANTYDAYGAASDAVAAAMNGTTGTLVKHTANTAEGSATNPVYIAADGTATASNATVGSATQTVYLNAGTITAGTTLGTAASASVATGTGAAGITDGGTGLVTADQVYEYVAANAGAANFIEDQVTDGTTNKAPSSNAVYDQLALKEDVISSTNMVDVAFVDSTNYETSGLKTTLDAAYDASGAASNAVAALDGGTISGTGVVKTISQTDGQVSATLSKVADADVADDAAIALSKLGFPTLANSTAGAYVLTGVSDGADGITYHWELISRTGNEGSGE